ncbi:MAG: TRAP transporter large permease subunit, partial [Treponema sp.]|nr:TRAP transporter large permease subunit [Treponema sp.]
FGIIMVVNLAIGFFTPPIGVNLFVASRIGNEGIETISRGIVPFVLVMFVCLMLITYVPQIAMILPSILGGR